MNTVRAGKRCWVPGIALALLSLPQPTVGQTAAGDSSAPALTMAQVRDDWLLQARLRYGDVDSVAGEITPEQDAAGGCDGVITGKWGFHTEMEEDPWWQVDLEEERPLSRLVIYNRCDRLSERAARLQVLLSPDGEQFAAVYEHDGRVFYGLPDKKPLIIPLQGKTARFVRLRLPGRTYFHLDEVQVLNRDGHNVALNKRATQSSTSQWSARHPRDPGAVRWPRVVSVTLQRGRRLAAALQALGADTSSAGNQLDRIERWLDDEGAGQGEGGWKDAYLQARQAIRQMLLGNPLLDFDRILFVKRAPSMFPHLSDQYYGWWARPGGGLYVLEHFKSPNPSIRCLTPAWPTGNFLRPDLSYAADRVLFAFSRYHPEVADIQNKRDKANLPADVFYHLFEMDLATGTHRQLTRGKYEDFDGRYLPDGRIVFLSTRKGRFIQTSRANTQATLSDTLPDSYVRCGGDDYRPVPVFTLHRVDADGRDIEPISAFETFEYTPSVAADGRILYCRWDYIDRFNGHFFSLWATNPDGTNAQLVYGNVTKSPQATMEPRSVPGSTKILFTAAAHHSITGGSLTLFDPTVGQEGELPITRLTPEVPFPEVEKNVGMFYANPWPLSEDFYLVSWSHNKLPPHGRYEGDSNPINSQGIYLADRFGNLELLYRDPQISSMTPLPVKPRPKPPVVASVVSNTGPQTGQMLLQDVYQGLTGVARGRITRLRIVGVLPKVQPHMNNPCLGVSREDTGKFVLGTVPVERDGSAYFSIPSGVPVFFQALDDDGYALQTMRSLTYVQPGQTLSCVGCHEPRQTAPVVVQPPLAMRRAPSRLQPGPVGSWPLRFDTLVQPVLDAHCLDCHQPAADDKTAARFDLSPARAWRTLLDYADKDLEKLVFERDVSRPGESPARESKLLQYLRSDPRHDHIVLEDEDLRRLVTWMDTYAQILGSFSADQERKLEQFRREYQHLLAD